MLAIFEIYKIAYKVLIKKENSDKYVKSITFKTNDLPNIDIAGQPDYETIEVIHKDSKNAH